MFKSNGQISFNFYDAILFDPLSIGLGVAGVTGLAGSAIGANAASTASAQQQATAQQALANQQAIWGQVQNYFAPYVTSGNTAIENYTSSLPNQLSAIRNISAPTALQSGTYSAPSALTQNFKPFNPSDLTQTPGYQFTLNQGQQGVQSGFSAQGLNNSGAATKGAANYATGLADQTYNEQLKNYLTQYNTGLATQQQQFGQGLQGAVFGLGQQAQAYGQGLQSSQFGLGQQQLLNNLLFNAAGLGQNAVSSLSSAGLGSAQQVNNLLGNLGNAQAAGTIGTANAISGGISGLGNIGSTYGLLKYLKPTSNIPSESQIGF